MKRLELLATAALVLATFVGPATARQVTVETVASPAPFSVNAHIVSGPGGLVVIDSLRTADAAAVLVERLAWCATLWRRT